MTVPSERAILVHRFADAGTALSEREEFEALARAAGASIVANASNRRRRPDPGLYLGSGTVEAIGGMIGKTGAELVLVDEALSPAQERNLERALGVRVLDRTGLILDIFAQRARSFEGRLEVERAQLRHLATRLVRGWVHLERQRGGIGLRGPGETQLETDRRLIARRIDQLNRRLKGVAHQRAQSQARRQRNGLPVVALVGYTNAGKSTLFNRLTGERVHASDSLFATLDPLLRRIVVPGVGPVVIADTVGFVSRLPHELIEAFRATLTQARDADVLLHVIDASAADREDRIAIVNQVLEEIGAGGLPQIEIYNKVDLLALRAGAKRGNGEGRLCINVCARTGAGLQDVPGALATAIGVSEKTMGLQVRPEGGALRARLHAMGAVVNEQSLPEGGWQIDVRLRRAMLVRLLAETGQGEATLLRETVC